MPLKQVCQSTQNSVYPVWPLNELCTTDKILASHKKSTLKVDYYSHILFMVKTCSVASGLGGLMNCKRKNILLIWIKPEINAGSPLKVHYKMINVAQLKVE